MLVPDICVRHAWSEPCPNGWLQPAWQLGWLRTPEEPRTQCSDVPQIVHAIEDVDTSIPNVIVGPSPGLAKRGRSGTGHLHQSPWIESARQPAPVTSTTTPLTALPDCRGFAIAAVAATRAMTSSDQSSRCAHRRLPPPSMRGTCAFCLSQPAQTAILTERSGPASVRVRTGPPHHFTDFTKIICAPPFFTSVPVTSTASFIFSSRMSRAGW